MTKVQMTVVQGRSNIAEKLTMHIILGFNIILGNKTTIVYFPTFYLIYPELWVTFEGFFYLLPNTNKITYV
jgi:hypothetical protein